MHGFQSRGGFTQRPGRQQPAVAEAARAVDHGDFEVALEAQVLQAIVADDDLGALLGRQLRGRNAVRTDDDDVHAALRVQQRLVTDHCRIVRQRHDPGRPAVRAAIAAQHDADSRPRSLSCRASQAATGVLPVPPTVMLPTTTTGTSTAMRSRPRRYSQATQRDHRAEHPGQRQQRQARQSGPYQRRCRRLSSDMRYSLNCSRCSTAYWPSRASSSWCVPDLDHAPGIHHEDAVGLLDGRKPVRDHERRAVGHQRLELVLDLALEFGVERGRRLVEDQDRRVAQQRTCDRDALALPAREQRAAVADDRVEP